MTDKTEIPVGSCKGGGGGSVYENSDTREARFISRGGGRGWERLQDRHLDFFFRKKKMESPYL